MKLDGNNNKNKLYIIIIVGLLFLFVVGISFAYFQTQYGNGGKVDLKAKTYSVDELSFNIGEDITINPNQFNFAQGKGNLEGSTNASAILKANNKTHLAKMNYYAYVVVTKNEFKYTTSDKKAELVLSVEGPDGVVTTLPDLGNAIDVTDNAGNTFKAFDITEFSGVITLADNKEIEVASSDNGKKQENWKIKVTFINLDEDQSNNSDKNFNANMMIQKDEYVPTVADVCAGKTLSDCVIAQHTMLNGHNNIYYHDSNLANGAGDNSYRFAGANPNNYVCFGSDDTICPSEDLYRIIGVFGDKVKLIHAYGATTDMLGTDEGYAKTYQEAWGSSSSYYKGNGDLTKIGSYRWNKVKDNTWSTSTTNTINLNKNFLIYLDSKNTKWKTMINNTTWYAGGMTYANGWETNAKTAYNYEVGANKDATTVIAKIGLMYVSEYYYAATPDYWTLPGYNSSGNDYRKATNDNWLYTGLKEWTISRRSVGSDLAFVVTDDGLLLGGVVDDSDGIAVRPSFSLSSSIKFTSGEGTAVNPIRLN